MKNDLVSIIIPAYNASNFLSEAIDAALNQTYKNIEIIVVNDGSPDDGATEKVALSYGDKIRYFKKENGGCSSALNLGIKMMEGQFFSWLSHDDLYVPEKIEKEIESFDKFNLSKDSTVIACEAQLIDVKGNKIPYPLKSKYGYLESEAALQDLTLNKTYHGCGLLIPKKILDQIGLFDETRKMQMDFEYWVKIMLNGFNFYVLSDVLVKGRVHGEQATVTENATEKKEAIIVLNDLYDYIIKNKIDDKYIKYFYYYTQRKGKKECSKKFRELMKNRNCFDSAIRLNGLKYSVYGDIRRNVGKIYHASIRKIPKK